MSVSHKRVPGGPAESGFLERKTALVEVYWVVVVSVSEVVVSIPVVVVSASLVSVVSPLQPARAKLPASNTATPSPYIHLRILVLNDSLLSLSLLPAPGRLFHHPGVGKSTLKHNTITIKRT